MYASVVYLIAKYYEMFGAITDEGVIARGIKKSLLSVNTWQLRNFSNGPSSTTCAANIGAINRPSEVPPEVDSSLNFSLESSTVVSWTKEKFNDLSNLLQ
jgi:hypothetical protein